ncbi:MAG: AMP-binding protein [Actinomycetota bacterium]
MEMHFATIWESAADALPDRPAVVQGDLVLSWREYEERAARLAGALSAAGLEPDAKVALFLYNGPEYCEANFAALKQRMVPINVNYRYLDDELHYLLENCDAEAIVFHTSLGDRIARVRERLPLVKLLVQVDDGAAPDGSTGVEGAVAYEELLARTEPAERIGRSEDDTYMLYTGGTTGMPKGVMYPVGQFTKFFLDQAPPILGLPPFDSAADVGPNLPGLADQGLLLTALPACPLMHGTGIWVGVMSPHLTGSTVTLLEARSLDADELWRVVESRGVSVLVIVGDAFARPLLRALRDQADSGGSYDLSSLRFIVSTGAMFSPDAKQGLMEFAPQVIIIDALGSTEGSMGQSVAAGGQTGEVAKFMVTEKTKVFGDDDIEVTAGSDEVGMVATCDNVPVGYYKDPEKTARTFRVIDGVRWSFPGDMATVDADGVINFLGRGSNCINTGGEKVFPEEVEEAVKATAGVRDCLVFGLPDERFGNRVVGVASAEPGVELAAADVLADVRGRLSSYKLPKELRVVELVPRAPNGKADYVGAKELFAGTPE